MTLQLQPSSNNGPPQSRRNHAMRRSQLFLALALTIVAASIGTARESKRTALPITWNLKYKSGSLQLSNGQWLKAAFVSNESATEHGPILISILPNQVHAIYFDPGAQKDSDVAQRMPRSG